MDKEILIQKRKVFYRLRGEGRPVIFLHGVPADGNLWINQLKGLPFKCITPDLPGSGRSEIINDMSMEGMAEVIRAILDAEEISSASLIGHSMGGYISLAFAEKYPHYLSGLGLFHSTSYPDTEEKKEARRKGIKFIKEHGASEFLKTTTYNLFSQQTKDRMPKLIDEFMTGLRNFRTDTLVSYYEAMMQRPGRQSILKTLNIPMLFIAGKYDTAIPVNDMVEQCHLPEISYFHILAKSSHMGMLEEPGIINNILNEYLINLS